MLRRLKGPQICKLEPNVAMASPLLHTSIARMHTHTHTYNSYADHYHIATTSTFEPRGFSPVPSHAQSLWEGDRSGAIPAQAISADSLQRRQVNWAVPQGTSSEGFFQQAKCGVTRGEPRASSPDPGHTQSLWGGKRSGANPAQAIFQLTPRNEGK